MLSKINSGPNFSNNLYNSLPRDACSSNYVRQVKNACLSGVKPTPVDNPTLVVSSASALSLVDLPDVEGDKEAEAALSQFLSGNRIWPESQPSALCYCGYQFGNFAGQLGDGAAISLGDLINARGERSEIQLKGAGKTPYSRTADGRKVLRSNIREFLCSEAMFHLGIPTTRAAAVVTSDTLVERDPFYDGHVVEERASITARVAPSFLRFGSFEICHTLDPETHRVGPSVGNPALLRQLGDFVIENFYPEPCDSPEQTVEMYAQFYRQVVERTARLVAQWQSVGFCHGVLNTDNMSILGVTIDYGPYGFMEHFDWDHICNQSDRNGRYSYRKQPDICRWNCAKLADSLTLALSSASPGEANLRSRFETALNSTFMPVYRQTHCDLFRGKLGLFASEENDETLVRELLDTMHEVGADFTRTFLLLTEHMPQLVRQDVSQLVEAICAISCSLEETKLKLKPKLSAAQRTMIWNAVQHDRQRLIEAGASIVIDDEEKLRKMAKLKDWTECDKRRSDAELWSHWLGKFVERLQSDVRRNSPSVSVEERQRVMRRHNPQLVLRNHLAELAIRDAERGDYSTTKSLFRLLCHPYEKVDVSGVLSDHAYDERRPNWASTLRVT